MPELDIPYIGVEKADGVIFTKIYANYKSMVCTYIFRIIVISPIHVLPPDILILVSETSIEQVSLLLQEAIRDICFLEFEVNVLKVEVIDLRCDLEKACTQILGHQRVFRKLIGSKSDSIDEEYDYESTDKNSNAQKVTPQTDQVSD